MGDSRTLTILRVSSTVVHVTALTTTVYRAFYRIRFSSFSWDDLWALVAFCMDAICLVGVWVMAHLNDSYSQMTPEIFHSRRIVLYWLVNATSVFEIWLSRMSLAYTFVRLLPVGRPRIISILLIISFMICWVPALAWKLHTCTHDKSWAYIPRGSCKAARALDVLEITIDAISCAVLMLFTAYVLWQTNLPYKERRLITFLLTGSIFSAVACSVHSLFTLSGQASFQSFTVQIEAAISLVACNVLVIMACIYNLLSRNRHTSPVGNLKASLFHPWFFNLRSSRIPTHEQSAGQGQAQQRPLSCSTQISNAESCPCTVSTNRTILTFTEVSSRRDSDESEFDLADSRSQCGANYNQNHDELAQSRSQSHIRDSVYLTESEACSGSCIVILDSDSDSETGSHHRGSSLSLPSIPYSYPTYPTQARLPPDNVA